MRHLVCCSPGPSFPPRSAVRGAAQYYVQSYARVAAAHFIHPIPERIVNISVAAAAATRRRRHNVPRHVHRGAGRPGKRLGRLACLINIIIIIKTNANEYSAPSCLVRRFRPSASDTWFCAECERHRGVEVLQLGCRAAKFPPGRTRRVRSQSPFW